MQNTALKNCLVALIPNRSDWYIAENFGWYRIPVQPAPAIVKSGQVKYIAFYFPKAFEQEAYQVKFYAKVTSTVIKHRTELFPEEPINSKSSKQYYVLSFDAMEQLKHSIHSHKPRRILFIPTTEYKLFNATDINDVFSDSPLEERIWEAFKQRNIAAERQYVVQSLYHLYILDFAIFCQHRNLDIECDGDEFHNDKKQVQYDKSRNNKLASLGWSVMRFTTDDINNRLDDSLQLVHNTIRSFGGLKL